VLGRYRVRVIQSCRVRRYVLKWMSSIGETIRGCMVDVSNKGADLRSKWFVCLPDQKRMETLLALWLTLRFDIEMVEFTVTRRFLD